VKRVVQDSNWSDHSKSKIIAIYNERKCIGILLASVTANYHDTQLP